MTDEQQIDSTETLSQEVETPEVEEVDEQEVDDVDETSEDEGEGDKKSDLPKEVEKALRKKDRYNKNLLNRLRETEAKLQQLQQSFKPNAGNAPREEDFDNYGEYLKASMRYEMKQELQGEQQKQQTEALTQEHAAIRQQQDEVITAQVEQIATKSPDFSQVMSKNMQVIDAMPQHISDLVYQVDNAVIGAYALAKEGRLQDLYYMNPQIAAAELIAAQYRGQEYLKKGSRQSPAAPQPMKSLKGTGSAGRKDINTMSGDELLKWVNS